MELEGKRIAILAEDNYQELELWYSLLRMREAGAEVVIERTGKAVKEFNRRAEQGRDVAAALHLTC